ncbi:MAG: hypothetical protein CME62_14635 [Halobacteriovoraceae bacterium]|nr:hypothetical protein [Halobacteriovoraceae bacterium]|tara:strand:+ start:4771 stop:5451 length:681 start_codon:yes stop_codon:yes gene_type:complete
MNRIIVYGLILLAYLILSKSLSPFEFGISYVKDQNELSKLIKGAPVTAILTDVHTTGFAIKTYYLKFKIVYGFESYEELVIRSSSAFSEKLSPFLGLSVFSRTKSGEESMVPLIPGSIFVGDKTYGSWKNQGDKKLWRFFRVYRQIPVYLGWGDYTPSFEDFNKMEMNRQQNTPYFGDTKLFGLEGELTQKSFPDYFARKNKKTLTWQEFLENYFNENFINYKEQL